MQEHVTFVAKKILKRLLKISIIGKLETVVIMQVNIERQHIVIII